MNRRHFLSTLGAAGSVALATPVDQAMGQSTNAQESLSTISTVDGTPAVYALTDSCATILWTLNTAARGWIEYGESRELGQLFRSDAFGFVPHHERVIKIRLMNLKPGIRYYWRTITAPLAGGEQVASPIYSFKTLNPGAEETSFTVWNDTHDHAETIQKLHAFTSTAPSDFLVWNGDFCNNIEKQDILPGLYVHPKMANLAECPPIIFTRGNHDTRGLWANKVPDYVDFPSGRPFHAFRSGPLAAIFLDTGEDKPDRHPSFKGIAAFEPLIQEQKQWLAQVIQQPQIKSAPFRLVFCHIPLRWKTEKVVDYDKSGFDWFSKRGRDHWHDSLVEWKAQAIVSGHTHQWACLPETTEFPYAQITGGGPDLTNATLIRGHITSREMKIVIHALDGKELHASTFSAA